MPFRARTYIGSSVTSSESRITRPESGAASPTVMANVVVLPAPFGPSRPTISPEDTSMLTPRTTVRPPYDLVSWIVRSVDVIQRDDGDGWQVALLLCVRRLSSPLTMVLLLAL